MILGNNVLYLTYLVKFIKQFLKIKVQILVTPLLHLSYSLLPTLLSVTDKFIDEIAHRCTKQSDIVHESSELKHHSELDVFMKVNLVTSAQEDCNCL